MKLTLFDWSVVAGYFAINLLIGLWYRKQATGSTEDYFVSGRNASWWLAGTSMVATTFAADTPLAVTGLVASYGIAGNWLWWNLLLSNMLTVFFFARLWRRAGVVTDLEFDRTPLRWQARGFPPRLSRPLPGFADQLHHPGLGEPGDGEDSVGDLP